MQYSTLDLKHEVLRTRAHIQALEGELRRPITPDDRADAMILLDLYRRRVEGLQAEVDLAWCKEEAAKGRDGADGAAHHFQKLVVQWHRELPDWEKAHDAIGERRKAHDGAINKTGGAETKKELEGKIWDRSKVEFAEWALEAARKGEINIPENHRVGKSDRQTVIHAAKGFLLEDKETGKKEPLDGAMAYKIWAKKNR